MQCCLRGANSLVGFVDESQFLAHVRRHVACLKLAFVLVQQHCWQGWNKYADEEERNAERQSVLQMPCGPALHCHVGKPIAIVRLRLHQIFTADWVHKRNNVDQDMSNILKHDQIRGARRAEIYKQQRW